MIKQISIIILLLSLSCNHSKTLEQDYSQVIIENNEKTIHPGKKLMETNCYVCHNPETAHVNRIAPPMVAVKMHYKSENTTKKEFISDFQDWIKNPTEENAKMYGAVRKFGVMPKTPYPEETISLIAEYIFDNDIEKPEWFDSHQGEGNGMNRGNGNGNGKRKGMMQGKGKNKESFGFTKQDKSFSEIGLHYALSTKKELGRNLMGTIQKKGTIEALKFCNEKAYPLTDSMSTQHNAIIKRVSDKPRNIENKANALEQAYINDFKKTVLKGEEVLPITVERGEEVQFYYPIVTNSMCLQCHGKVGEQIDKDSYKTIKALYPEDKAIGYDVNNVRGIWSITFNKN